MTYTTRHNASLPTDALPLPLGVYDCCGTSFVGESWVDVARQHLAFHTARDLRLAQEAGLIALPSPTAAARVGRNPFAVSA